MRCLGCMCGPRPDSGHFMGGVIGDRVQVVK